MIGILSTLSKLMLTVLWNSSIFITIMKKLFWISKVKKIAQCHIVIENIIMIFVHIRVVGIQILPGTESLKLSTLSSCL